MSTRSRPPPCASSIVAAAAIAALAPPPAAADSGDPPLRLEPSTVLAPAPRGDAAASMPSFLRADSLRLRPDLDADAMGNAEFRRAGTVLRADRVHYDSAEDRASAYGDVRISRSGMVFTGPEVQLDVQRFEGYFLHPGFDFTALGAGGQAERLDFLGPSRVRADQALYTSCPRDGSGVPDWLLEAEHVTLDFDANDGVAEGAVLRFLDTTILRLPTMSFPLSDARRSGWLPPTLALDSRNGLMLGVPYYLNLAPNRDATIEPTAITRRGLALEGEYRYLEPGYAGQLNLHVLPYDRSVDHARGAFRFAHDGVAFDAWQVHANALHVSDQDYWKDFPQFTSSTIPRLLSQDFGASRSLWTPLGAGQLYAQAQYWQLMQTGSGSDLIVAPYQRSPQLGWRLQPASYAGFAATLETEVNHFTLPAGSASPTDPTGWRWHALGSIARPFGDSAWWLTPKLTLNAAAYSIDPDGTALAPRSSRLIPTFSIDAGMVFERESTWFGGTQRQTLEPRVLYVNTPYRDQTRFPNFDSMTKTFNFVSIYAESAFSGIDRVADANQMTAGVTTRLIDDHSGAETMRLAVAQRLLLRDQRITPDGVPITQRLSDLLVEGSSILVPKWHLDGAVQYNADHHRVVNSTLAARYSPGPFRNLSAGYRLVNNLPGDVVNLNAEQIEFGWQWPVYRGTARPVGASHGCGGELYAVGRVNYSLADSRLTDSVVGFEYDAGCWIGRVVSERLSTGRSEATTRIMVQLELVGLSRLGSNPLQVLKDNIPGYRMLRDRRGSTGDDANDAPSPGDRP